MVRLTGLFECPTFATRKTWRTRGYRLTDGAQASLFLFRSVTMLALRRECRSCACFTTRILASRVRVRSRIVEFLSFIEFNEGTSFEFELKTWRFDSKRSFFLSFFLVTVRKESKEGNRIDKFHRVIETRSRYQLIKCNIRSYRGFSQRDITSIVRASFGVIKNE